MSDVRCKYVSRVTSKEMASHQSYLLCISISISNLLRKADAQSEVLSYYKFKKFRTLLPYRILSEIYSSAEKGRST